MQFTLIRPLPGITHSRSKHVARATGHNSDTPPCSTLVSVSTPVDVNNTPPVSRPVYNIPIVLPQTGNHNTTVEETCPNNPEEEETEYETVLVTETVTEEHEVPTTTSTAMSVTLANTCWSESIRHVSILCHQ